jgi:ribonuclease G
MAEEIIISVSPHETRVAVVEQGLMQEIFLERSHTPGTVGNVYKGKVLRVLPGMQSAFVDIGHAKAAFLHVTDLIDTHEAMMEKRGPDFAMPPIHELVHEGQKLLVQVTKEPIGTKGARITANLSLASRFLVYIPGTSHIGVSQRIEDEAERDRLRRVVTSLGDARGAAPGDGFVVRTASEGADADEIASDGELLRARWRTIQEDGRTANTPALIYEDLPLHLRVMRDLISQRTDRIVTDNVTIFDALQRFLTDFMPKKSDCLTIEQGAVPLFDAHNLEDQLESALDRKVGLKSGGYMVIDQTEAMNTVDVNTGGFVGRNDLEETIYRTNLEAAAAIPRQLRLRNIGGIVILDFIDMVDEEHKRQVLRTLEKGQQQDRVKWNISEISQLGLVEMTRKRTDESLMKTMCEPCAACNGRGFIKSAESVCVEIFREVKRRSLTLADCRCMIRGAQTVIDRLLDEDAEMVTALGETLGVALQLQVEPAYSQEEYDVVRLH